MSTSIIASSGQTPLLCGLVWRKANRNQGGGNFVTCAIQTMMRPVGFVAGLWLTPNPLGPRFQRAIGVWPGPPPPPCQKPRRRRCAALRPPGWGPPVCQRCAVFFDGNSPCSDSPPVNWRWKEPLQTFFLAEAFDLHMRFLGRSSEKAFKESVQKKRFLTAF